MATTRDTYHARRLGARIRAARRASHLSMSTLANRLGISLQQVAKYEIGQDRLTVEMLERIADALGRPMTDFLDPQEGEAA